MSGLIAAQIRITGDLEKDQQLLIYGIGGLIGLIVIAMIVILLVVLVRRGKASRAAAAALQPVSAAEPVTHENSYKPAVSVTSVAQEPVQEPTPPPVVETVPEQQPEPVVAAQPVEATVAVPAEPVVPADEPKPAEPQEKNERSKYDFGAYKEELAQQNPDDKMDEIRRRLEEIKRQRQTEPAPVLPKIEAKPAAHEVTPVTETNGDDPIVPEEEILAEEEIDETRLVNEEPQDPETVPVTEVPQVERLEPQTEAPAEVVEEEVPAELPEAEAPVAEEAPKPLQEHPQALAKEEQLGREEIHSEGHTYYTVPNEPVMELQRDPQPEPASAEKSTQEEPAKSPFPNGKFLPMKKLTFAEWVELFK